MKAEFTPERLQRFKKIVAKYEVAASAVLPVLYLAQEQFGYLTPEVQEYVAGLLDMPPAKVVEVTSFYFLLKRQDRGKHCLQVCNNITCTLMGSEAIIDVAKQELGIGLGALTEDKQFSLYPVQCLGSCDTAPVVQINDDYHENLTPDKFRDVIQSLRRASSVVL